MLRGTNEFLSVVLKLVVIVVIVLTVCMVGLSVFAHFTEDKGLPEFPALADAPYIIQVRNTGQILLGKPEAVSSGKVLLKGYYTLRDNKWVWLDGSLSLDEHYFGDIIIIKRGR